MKPGRRFDHTCMALVCCFLGLSSITGGVAEAKSPPVIDAAPATVREAQIAACWGMLDRDPTAALRFARRWDRRTTDSADGIASHRCAAAALAKLGNPAAAAEILDEIAVAVRHRSHAAEQAVLRDAGRAWMMAGRPRRAYHAFRKAIDVGGPLTGTIYLDRAIARDVDADYAGALRDLREVVRRRGPTREVLLVRADIYRRLGWLKLARQDIATVLASRSFDAQALVERGRLRLASGNAAGALADWMTVRRMADGTTFGAQATRLIALLRHEYPTVINKGGK